MKRQTLRKLEKKMEQFFSDKWMTILLVCFSNILTVLITFFSLKPDNFLFRCIYLAIIIIVTVFVVSIIMHLAVIDFRFFANKYKEAIANHELSKALPETFIFRDRKDSFVVTEEGDVLLTWKFEIEKITNNSLSFISLPIICERKNKDEKDTPVEIKSFFVNGKEQTNRQYDILSVERYDRFGEELERPLERGMIKIPLFTASHKGGIEKVELKVFFKGMFLNYKKKEFAIVDIPYITKNISVTIEHEHNEKWDINVIDNFLDVREMNSNTYDVGELARQLNNCLIIHDTNRLRGGDIDCLLWECEFPKLGYRYKLDFNFNERKSI